MGFLETPSQMSGLGRGQSHNESRYFVFFVIDTFISLEFVMGFLETPSLSEDNISSENLIGFCWVDDSFPQGTWTVTCRQS